MSPKRSTWWDFASAFRVEGHLFRLRTQGFRAEGSGSPDDGCIVPVLHFGLCIVGTEQLTSSRLRLTSVTGALKI